MIDKIKPMIIDNLYTREIFTRAQAAEYLGVTVRYLDMQAMHCTDLPMYKLGRLARYRKADLDKWLESKKVTNAKRVDKTDEKLP